MAFTRSGVRSPSPPCREAGTPGLSRYGTVRFGRRTSAGIAQLVEHNLAKVGVAGSSPVSRSPRRNSRAQRRSEEHTSELQSLRHLVCRLLLEKKKHNG